MAVTISKALIEAAAKRNVFAQEGFRLFPGFAGKYEVKEVEPRAVQGSSKPNAFAIVLESTEDGKRLVIPDWVIGRAFIVTPDEATKAEEMEIEMDDEKYESVGYTQENEEIIAGAQRFASKYLEKDEDGNWKDETTLPDFINIAGAVTTKVQDDQDDEDSVHPALPLRYYKGYSAVLRHHRQMEKEAGNENWETAFLTRAQFLDYIEENADHITKNSTKKKASEGLIEGLNPDIEGLELTDETVATKMGLWSTNVVISDVVETPATPPPSSAKKGRKTN
jgi:hypothetical protein